MQTENPNTPQSTNSALRRTRARLLAMGSAAAILVVGLGAFALIPQTRPTPIADTAKLGSATEVTIMSTIASSA